MSSQFIGSGITFPIELNSNGRPDYVNDIELVKSSMLNILYWPKNTRFFNENFGSRIDELLEEPNDNVAKSLLNTFVKEALSQEKRIIVNKVTITSYNIDSVNVSINFYLRSSKIEETFIFPYYKNI